MSVIQFPVPTMCAEPETAQQAYESSKQCEAELALLILNLSQRRDAILREEKYLTAQIQEYRGQLDALRQFMASAVALNIVEP